MSLTNSHWALTLAGGIVLEAMEPSDRGLCGGWRPWMGRLGLGLTLLLDHTLCFLSAETWMNSEQAPAISARPARSPWLRHWLSFKSKNEINYFASQVISPRCPLTATKTGTKTSPCLWWGIKQCGHCGNKTLHLCLIAIFLTKVSFLHACLFCHVFI